MIEKKQEADNHEEEKTVNSAHNYRPMRQELGQVDMPQTASQETGANLVPFQC